MTLDGPQKDYLRRTLESAVATWGGFPDTVLVLEAVPSKSDVGQPSIRFRFVRIEAFEKSEDAK